MKVFICSKNGIIYPNAYTSLLSACASLAVSYSSASRGKMSWVNGVDLRTIDVVFVIKIKNRGKK